MEDWRKQISLWSLAAVRRQLYRPGYKDTKKGKFTIEKARGGRGGGGFPLPSRHRTVGTVRLQPPYKFHGEEDPTAILLKEGSFRRAGPARRYFRVTVYVFRVLIGGLAFSYRRNRSTR